MRLLFEGSVYNTKIPNLWLLFSILIKLKTVELTMDVSIFRMSVYLGSHAQELKYDLHYIK